MHYMIHILYVNNIHNAYNNVWIICIIHIIYYICKIILTVMQIREHYSSFLNFYMLEQICIFYTLFLDLSHIECVLLALTLTYPGEAGTLSKIFLKLYSIN